MAEAEQFENLALCQRPEFVPYLRRKLKAKYPELSTRELDQMTRGDLCKLLLNVPELNEIDLPIKIWQIKNVPPKFKNQSNYLINLWDTRYEQEMNTWLIKNYGVTLNELREYNKNERNADVLEVKGKLLQAQETKRQQRETRYQENLLRFREVLRGLRSCSEFKSQDDCEVATKFSTEDNQSLCAWTNGTCAPNKDISGTQVLKALFKTFCQSKVRLFMNDFEFIIEAYKTLVNFYTIMKFEQPARSSRLDLQCKSISKMFNKLLEQASLTNTSWRSTNLDSLENNNEFKQVVNQFFPSGINVQNYRKGCVKAGSKSKTPASGRGFIHQSKNEQLV